MNATPAGRPTDLPGFFVAVALLFSGAFSIRADFQGSTHLMPFDEDTINYSKAPDTSPIARLQKRIDCGEVKLGHEGETGYLRALLCELGISTNSQTLVFSKTSFQRERIGPKTPRALFFNDDVYVGLVPGSPLLEISAVDPKLGAVFYTLEQTKFERPKFVRTDQCLECHASAKSMGVPGHLLRSFATDDSGIVDLASGTSLVNHRTPIEERWLVRHRHARQPDAPRQSRWQSRLRAAGEGAKLSRQHHELERLL